MTSWYNVDKDSKGIISAGMAQNEETARIQTPAAGCDIYVLPDGLITWDPTGRGLPDFSLLKQYLCDHIDEALAKNISPFDSLRAAKAVEARQFLDGERLDSSRLEAEVKARQALGEQITLTQLAETVVAKAVEARELSIQLEAMRVAVKAAIWRAENLPDIISVSQLHTTNNG